MDIDDNDMIYNAYMEKIQSESIYEALVGLSQFLFEDKCSVKYYELSSFAVIRSLKEYRTVVSADLNEWSKEIKHRFYLKLIRQDNCIHNENIFIKTITAHQSTKESWVFPAVAKAFEPILEKLHSRGKLTKSDVLFILVIRNFVSFISQEEISRIHLATLSEFTKSDLTYAYHNIFDASLVYNRNIQDIGIFLQGTSQNASKLEMLNLIHILLIVWIYSRQKRYPYKIAELSDLITSKIGDDNDDEPEITRSAAKGLLAHHALELRRIDEVKLRELIGMINDKHEWSSVIDKLEHNQSNIKTAIKNEFSNDIGKKLNSKFYSAAMACKNFAISRIGFRKTAKKLKVAVCISGQLRGFKKTFETWKKGLLTNVDYDIFVHSWYDIGRSGAEPTRKSLPFDGINFQKGYRECFLALGFEDIKKNYPTLFDRLKQSGIVTEEVIKSFYDAKEVVLEDDKAPKYEQFTNSEKMHCKIHLCNNLYKKADKDYDLVLRIRPDLPIKYIGFDWKDIYKCCKSEPVIFADFAYGVHYMSLVIGDQFAVGIPEVMDVYSDAWNIYPELGKARIFGCSKAFKGHISLGMTCWVNGIKVNKIPLKKGALQDTENMRISEIHAAIKNDAKDRAFSWDKKLLDSLKRDGAK